jgi:hypothetical protein
VFFRKNRYSGLTQGVPGGSLTDNSKINSEKRSLNIGCGQNWKEKAVYFYKE